MSLLSMLMGRTLIHTCTIAPGLPGIEDSGGHQIPGFGTPVTGVECRLTDLDDEERIAAESGDTQRFTDALILPIATAIAPGSRVTAIAGIDDAGDPFTIEDGPFDVIDVKTRFSYRAEYKRALINRTT